MKPDSVNRLRFCHDTSLSIVADLVKGQKEFQLPVETNKSNENARNS